MLHYLSRLPSPPPRHGTPASKQLTTRGSRGCQWIDGELFVKHIDIHEMYGNTVESSKYRFNDELHVETKTSKKFLDTFRLLHLGPWLWSQTEGQISGSHSRVEIFQISTGRFSVHGWGSWGWVVKVLICFWMFFLEIFLVNICLLISLVNVSHTGRFIVPVGF